MSREIKVIGSGGIGSFLAHHIDRLIDLKQLKPELNFSFYDDDKVEMKNILYQNFETEDIDSQKTEALAARYFNINFVDKRLEQKDLANAELVVLCADNNKIRREAWENWVNNGVPFIDSRANGRAVGIYSCETHNYLETLSESNDSSSCQNPFQIEKKEIEYGNVVIAAALAQVILNYSRTMNLPADIMLNI